MTILTELDLTRMEDDSWRFGGLSPSKGVQRRELIRLARLGMKYEQEHIRHSQERDERDELVCELCGGTLICELCGED